MDVVPKETVAELHVVDGVEDEGVPAVIQPFRWSQWFSRRGSQKKETLHIVEDGRRLVPRVAILAHEPVNHGGILVGHHVEQQCRGLGGLTFSNAVGRPQIGCGESVIATGTATVAILAVVLGFYPACEEVRAFNSHSCGLNYHAGDVTGT